MTRRHRSAAALGLAVTAALLTGCSAEEITRFTSMSHVNDLPGLGPVEVAREVEPEPVAEPETVVLARAVPELPPVPVREVGDLDTGSVTRQLNAGASSLVIDYWTTQNVGEWRADMTVPVQLSAHIEGANGRNRIKVTRFSATLQDATQRVKIAEDAGEFAIQPPFSYGTAVLVPPLAPTTPSALLSVQFDLLVETAPKSGQFFRQTVLDTVKLSYLPPAPAPAPTPAEEDK